MPPPEVPYTASTMPAPDLAPDRAAQLAPQLAFDRSGLRAGDRICVAVSGGADSVALLRVLHAANAAPRLALGVGLSAVHVHHGIRGAEADGDEAFVQQVCDRLGLVLHVERADVPGRRSATSEGLEAAAREVRYEIFDRLLRSGEADAVLTAHTMDDQTETVMLKLLRGAWTEGLGGIHPVVQVPIAGKAAGRILRPLLRTRRGEVEAYLRSIDQPWREDASNADPAFTRNRLRHHLLPQLREFNPALDEALSHLSELAREDEERWKAELSRVLPQLLLPGKPTRGGGRVVGTGPGPGSLALEIERLRSLDPSLRRRVLRAAARQLGARISFAETSRLLALCGLVELATVAPKPGSSLRISGDLLAERSVRELRLSYHPS